MKNTIKWFTTSCIALFIGISSTNVFAAETTNSTSSSYVTSNAIVKKDGSLWVWGGSRNEFIGEWGNEQNVPTAVTALSNVQKVVDDNFVVHTDHTVTFYKMGKLVEKPTEYVMPLRGMIGLQHVLNVWTRYWFVDDNNQLYTAEQQHSVPIMDTFHRVEGWSDTVTVQASDVLQTNEKFLLLLKKDGTVWKSDVNDVATAKQLTLPHPAVDIKENIVLLNDGTVWTVATDGAVTQVKKAIDIVHIESDNGTHAAINNQGNVLVFGTLHTGGTDSQQTYTQQAVKLGMTKKAKAVIVHDRLQQLFIQTTDNQLYVMSLQQSFLLPYSAPTLISIDVAQIEKGRIHIIVEKEDGSLWGWGINKLGDLGKGTYDFVSNKLVPVQKAIAVEVNGQPLTLPNGVLLRGDRAFLPLRAFFTSFPNTNVRWDSTTKTVSIINKTTNMEFHMPTGKAFVNDKEVRLESKPFIVNNGISYLPLRFISETLGNKVNWSQQEEKISIMTQ